MYDIFINDKLIKSYRYHLQCTIWCFGRGLVYTGRGYTWLDPTVTIKERREPNG